MPMTRLAMIALVLTTLSPRCRHVTAPKPDFLTLEMAPIEINPTQPKINATKFIAKLMFGPPGSMGGIMVQSRGNIAIEARIRRSRGGSLLYQLADNKSDKQTLYSVSDFRPYWHVDKSICQQPGTHISDASCWTLAPF